jgi:hypothetical protein
MSNITDKNDIAVKSKLVFLDGTESFGWKVITGHKAFAIEALANKNRTREQS